MTEVSTLFFFQVCTSCRKKPEFLSTFQMENSPKMYAPEFPEEIRRMILKKLPPKDLLRAYNAHEQFAQFRHEKTFEKIMENLTLDHLCELYNESETTEQKELCFHEQVIEKLRINSFNEVVRLYTRPENKDFFSNNRILESLHGQIILLEEPEAQESTLAKSEFWGLCVELFEKMKGDLFLTFMDFHMEFGSGRRGYEFRSRVKYVICAENKCNHHICITHVRNEFPNMEVIYLYIDCNVNHTCHSLILNTNNNCKDNLKKLLSFLNNDILQTARQSLEALLPMVQKRIASAGNEEVITCDHCPLKSQLSKEGILFMQTKPFGSKAQVTKCDHCMM